MKTLQQLLAVVADPETPEERDAAWKSIEEQLETARRDADQLGEQADLQGAENQRLREQLEALQDAVREHVESAHGQYGTDKHARLRAALSNPASEPTIDGEEPCPDCGAPRRQGCGCWLSRPDHPWAKRRGSFQESEHRA